MRRGKHSGFTLLEVVLALALMVIALFYLGNTFMNSLDAVRSSRDEIRATMVAESIMSEIAAGIRPPESVSDAQYAPDSIPVNPNQSWLYSVDVATLGTDGLIGVRVSVKPGSQSTASAPAAVLTKWMVDPTYMANLQAQSAANTATSDSSTSSSSSSSSNNSSGNSSNSNSGGSSNSTGT